MDFREKRTYDIFPMRFYDSVRRIFIFLKSLSLRDRRGRQKRVMVNASRRFSINRNAIADILFQGLNDLHFPSLSSNRLIIYGETRQLSAPEYGESIDPRLAYIYICIEKKRRRRRRNDTRRGREEGIFPELSSDSFRNCA